MAPHAAPPRPTVEALFLDLDGTLIDTWHRWSERTEWAFEELARQRGTTVDTLVEQITAATMDERVHSLRAVIRRLPCLAPRAGEDAAEVERKLELVAGEWDRRKEEGLDFFPGIRESLQAAYEAGTKIVVYTDSPWIDAVHALSRAGCDPKWLTMLAAQPHEKVPDPMDGGVNRLHAQDFDWAQKLGLEKLQVLRADRIAPEWWAQQPGSKTGELPRTAKPNPIALNWIVKTLGVAPERCLMVGDQARDGGSAKLNGIPGYTQPAPGYKGPNIAYAWAKYGAYMAPKELAFYDRVFRDGSYPLGDHIVSGHFEKFGFQPDMVLNSGYALGQDVRFVAPKPALGPVPGPLARMARRPRVA